MAEWIGAAEAAQRLGIKPASLYSYVSRGLLSRRRAADGRASLFDPAEIEELAHGIRVRRAAPPADITIETAITQLSEGQLRYRGLDVSSLARRHEFEDVAGLLWTGGLGGAGAGWQAPAAAVAAGSAAQAALPAGTLPLERLQVIVPALAAVDPFRPHLDPPAVIAAAQVIIAGMIACLPAASAAPTPAGQGIAGGLATRLCPAPLAPELGPVLRAAMILLADHELAASTFAVRVAASVRADPYAVVGAGLGVVSGPLHGGASLGVETMLASATSSGDATRVVGELLRRGERIPGFGHFVYRGPDPRAVLLLDLLRGAAPAAPPLAIADAVLAEARRRGLPGPNIEFVLAAFTQAAQMIPGAAEAIFAVARTAGWLAHALEEYARATPIRPRGIYPGPPPG